MFARGVIAWVGLVLLSGCVDSERTDLLRSSISEVSRREIVVPDYPTSGRTYLSYSGVHGFQVNYVGANGSAWLWYPDQAEIIPERFKHDVSTGVELLCWWHPADFYNQVTRKFGGGYSCDPLELARRSVIAVLLGDPFALSSGEVPYVFDKCTAPEAFVFDRLRFAC